MSHAVLVSLLAYALAAGLLTITPGVDTATVLRSSTVGGPAAGAGAAAGIAIGLLAWGAGAAFGLTAVMAASATAFAVLKWAGAAYLLVLGLRQIFARPGVTLAGTVPAGRRDAAAAFRRGLLSNLLNPKIGVFYLTFLPQFIPPGVTVAVFSLLLAGIHVALTLLWYAVLVALTMPLGRWLARPAVQRGLDRVTGCVFVAFGLKLAITERP